jgi:hypothetical protein
MDRFDEVFSVLTEDQGWSEENARKIMVYCAEQGMNPIEAGLRFIGGLGGLPTVDLRKPFFNPWNMFPKKPQIQQGLPKTGPSSTLPTQKALPPAKPISTPNQTQGMLGSRSVPTSRQLGQAPRPEWGTDKPRQWGPAKPPTAYEKIRPPADAGIRARTALNKPQVPQGTVSALSTLASLARGITPGGVAAAVMAPRPAGDGTLTGALKRGDYKPMQGPPAPKAPEQKPITKQKLSAAAKDFDKTFAAARAAGEKEFTWRGKRYNTKLK